MGMFRATCNGSLASSGLAAVAMVILAMPVAAHAGDLADADSPAATTVTAPSQTVPASLPEASGPVDAQDIVVTAQRRSERLQDVPAAITAFNANQLQKMGIDSTAGLSQVTPALNFTQSGHSPQPTIRGIGTRGINAGDESIVPIYIDGVYQAFIPSALMQLTGVERIEVLKGPQGALLGRNAMGGAINIITETPSSTPKGSASVSYGNFDEVIAKGYISGGTDTLSGSLAGGYDRDHGYIHSLTSDERYGKTKDLALRGKVRFAPSTRFDATVSGSYVNNIGDVGLWYYPLNGNTSGRRIPGTVFGTGDGYTTAQSITPRNDVRQYAGTLTFGFHLDGVDITSLSGYQNNKLQYLTDSDASSANVGTTRFRQTSHNFYQEVYAVSKNASPFQWIVGGTYFHDLSGFSPYVITSRAVSTTGILGATTVTSLVSSLKTDAFAAYVQGSYKFGDHLTLTAAGRYTYEKKDFNSQVSSPTLLTLANKANFKKFTPSGTLQYTFNRDFNVYAKVGTAFKSGLFNTSATSGIATRPVKPETLTQYELGLKSRVASWLHLDLSGFYTDYKNLQNNARDPVTGVAFLQNAGAAVLYGGEIEATISPIHRLNLNVGLSALHATYKDFTNASVIIPAVVNGVAIGGNTSAIVDVSGNKLLRTPFFTANVGGNYSVPLGSGDVSLSGNIFYSGASYWDATNRIREQPKVLANAEIGWHQSKGLGVALWGENLFNTNYNLYVTPSPTADNAMVGKPRTYGVRVSYDF